MPGFSELQFGVISVPITCKGRILRHPHPVIAPGVIAWNRNKSTSLHTRRATANSSPHICSCTLVVYQSMKRLATRISIPARLKDAFTKRHRLPFLWANHYSPELVSLVAVGSSGLCGAAFGTVKSSLSSLHLHSTSPSYHSNPRTRPQVTGLPLQQDTLTSRVSFYCIHLTVTLAYFR